MDLNQIERLLLHGAHFTREQREVIQARGRINVVAGPGSGKTTVLAAKVLLLMSNRQPEDKGICCITHTNVAVNEILTRLKVGGIDEVKYPNFVGTIQSFMDTFLGRMAFAKILPGVSMKLLDEDKYLERYEKKFRRAAKTYPENYSVPKPSKNSCELVISADGSFRFVNTNYANQSNINKACKWLLQDGITSYDDLKSMASWYLKKHEPELRSAFGERFSYLMLDEAQDTSRIQFEIINGLTRSPDLNVQRFGDPYQSLYTIYGTETEDSWKPNDEVPQFLTKEISETTRFGSQIAGLVRDVCMEEYPKFHSCQQKGTFPKYFLTYRTGEELKAKHTRLIESASSADSNFEALRKTDAIVGVMHADVNKIDSDHLKTSSNQRGRRETVKEIYDLIVELLAHTTNVSHVEEVQRLREDTDGEEELAVVIQKLMDGQLTVDQLCNHLIKLINLDSSLIENFKQDCERLDYSVGHLKSEPKHTQNTNSYMHREFATVHSIKGETQRSTLLVLDSCVHFKNGKSAWENEINKFFYFTFPYLIGERPAFSENVEVKKFQQDCLKLAYVALSRPQYLAAIAIPENDLDADKREKLLSHGWVEVK